MKTHRLFTTGEFSDLKITCGDEQHKVHTAIVCPRSELLSKLYAEIEASQSEPRMIITALLLM